MGRFAWLKINPPELLKPSVLLLVAANLVPLYGVFLFHWKVFPILVLFWMENVVVGIFNVFRMLVASPTKPVNWLVKVFMIPFFCIHYGLFTLAHGVFVFAFFSDYLTSSEILLDRDFVFQAIGDYQIVWAFIVLFISHAISFAVNYIGKGEYKQANFDILMSQPYTRVVIMHITIIAGGFLVASLGAPVFALLVLIFLKIFIDIQAHLREHKKYNQQKEINTAIYK